MLKPPIVGERTQSDESDTVGRSDTQRTQRGAAGAADAAGSKAESTIRAKLSGLLLPR